MTKKNASLNKYFGVEDPDETSSISKNVEVSDVEVSKAEVISEKSENNDIKTDYDYTRANLYSIIEKGQEAINGILELAQESEMPRAYEVAGQLIKNVADATDKLMDLQKKLRDVEEVKQQKGPTTVNNALFVGSTADLSKFLKSQLIDENK